MQQLIIENSTALDKVQLPSTKSTSAIVNNYTNNLDLETLHYFKWIDLKEIKLNARYQRAIEKLRTKKILGSIKKNGYWGFQTVLLNERNEIIDGQHRYTAAKELNIKQIGCSIITFPDEAKEATFFAEINNFNTSLKPVDFWYSRYLGGHYMAKLLHELNDDKESLLFKKIALKGEETKDTRFSIAETLNIMLAGILELSDHWDKATDERITEKIKDIPYQKIRNDVNTLCDFYYKCFGSKKENHIPFRSHSIKAINVFYLCLKKQRFIDNDINLKSAIKKMHIFIFTNDFLKTDRVGKIMSLVNHFNNGRRIESRLKYEVK